MIIIVYYKNSLKKDTFDGIRSLINNDVSLGIGFLDGRAFQYPKKNIKKVKVIFDAKS